MQEFITGTAGPTAMCVCEAAPDNHLVVTFLGYDGKRTIIKCRKFTIEHVADRDGNQVNFGGVEYRQYPRVADAPSPGDAHSDGQQEPRR